MVFAGADRLTHIDWVAYDLFKPCSGRQLLVHVEFPAPKPEYVAVRRSRWLMSGYRFHDQTFARHIPTVAARP